MVPSIKTKQSNYHKAKIMSTLRRSPFPSGVSVFFPPESPLFLSGSLALPGGHQGTRTPLPPLVLSCPQEILQLTCPCPGLALGQYVAEAEEKLQRARLLVENVRKEKVDLSNQLEEERRYVACRHLLDQRRRAGKLGVAV